MSNKKTILKRPKNFSRFLLVHDFRQIPKRIAIAVWVGISTGALMVYQTKVIGSACSLSLLRKAYFIYYLNCRVEVKVEVYYHFGLDNHDR